MGSKRKTLGLLFVVLFLFSSFALTHITVKAQTAGSIWINSDGSISPPSAPIQANGDVYYVTTDILSNSTTAIFVQKSNIVFNGNGFIIQGQGTKNSIGIDVTGQHNVTITDFAITNFWVNMHLENLVNCLIFNNKITTYSFEDGIDSSYTSGDLFSNNNILSYANLYESQNNGLILSNGFNETVSNNTLTGSYQNIFLSNTNNCTFLGNSISGSEVGMLLRYSNNNWLIGNNIFATIHADSHGIHPNSGTALKFYGDDSNNTILGNNISFNGGGIAMWINNSANIIYGNYFQNNTGQVSLFAQSGFRNEWDNGSMGNYWSDYLTQYPNSTEINHTGIGNTPYVIDQNNTDNHPLWQPDINAVDATTPSPTVPEFPFLVIFLLFVFVVSVAVLFRQQKPEIKLSNVPVLEQPKINRSNIRTKSHFMYCC